MSKAIARSEDFRKLFFTIIVRTRHFGLEEAWAAPFFSFFSV
jgi:hypothetical protein